MPHEVPANYFLDIDKIFLDFIWKVKRISLAKTILKKKNEVEEIILLNFKTYYKVMVIKMCDVGGGMDTFVIARENPGKDPQRYSQLNFVKATNAIQ